MKRQWEKNIKESEKAILRIRICFGCKRLMDVHFKESLSLSQEDPCSEDNHPYERPCTNNCARIYYYK